MEQTQVLRSLLLLLLLLPPPALSSRGQCVDETCSYDLQEYHSQMVNLPSHVHERSIAPWSYVQNIDLNRVPQVIQEASCHTSHSCRALEGSFSLETIPITLRVPVLKKNPACFPATGYSMDYELITVACLCALSRNN
ncbi:interleukin-17C-like [Periophthalmus magnuspinnatus]|uniref:interleukin-17C-like n=1 Tax=Periophthalmus magnuspinnatus TaxID=409849 RepID=UPI0024368E70|nr:interleukin-17C-like [Periophthalmus magnuspinnatus]